MDLPEYYAKYETLITQDSERLFVDEFLYPLLGAEIEHIEPQRRFIDATGRSRRIDFAYNGPHSKIALEVNGETYHAEGIIPNEAFDDNLYRQNEILRKGYQLVRFSYNQLQSPIWRELVSETLRDTFGQFAPELLTQYELRPTLLQMEALDALDFFRRHRFWTKGIVVLPTGTGKTVMSALDARRVGGRVLYLVHRLDILKQSVDAYRLAWPDMRVGILTGEEQSNVLDCDVLFASKDTLRQPNILSAYARDWFSYLTIDEVHHGQSPSYRDILEYFRPAFMLGMTATPDRLDRKDIFELFDYNKAFELPVQEAIDRGFLVPYSYYGLTDDIDYSRIRYDGQRYRVADLEKLLLVPERDEAILREYREKGTEDKAIGFCVSINHAERMAALFSENGYDAAAIHSQSADRDALIAAFRNDQLQVVFTVDLFNEGVDFPNVRVLLFLRPTESKTVFLQQLGRGLRLAAGKDRVRVLDFIGNYHRANAVRSYLAKSRSETRDAFTRKKKFLYEYSTNCEVTFDATVEEILDRQDAQDISVTADDLKEAYFELAETLGRKPTRLDLDTDGEYKSALYSQVFGAWVTFLRSVGEYTEASYRYPQGVHLGHILAILDAFGGGSRSGGPFDDKYIRLRGALGQGRTGRYQRQIKYKLLAAMELGILTDDRDYVEETDYELDLTPRGRGLYKNLKSTMDGLDLQLELGAEGIPTTRMKTQESDFNAAIRVCVHAGGHASTELLETFLNMTAVQQMLAFLYGYGASEVPRSAIYEQFFQSPLVRRFCDQEGIEEATLEASRRRCPFLINILDACDVVGATTTAVVIKAMVLTPSLVRPHDREDAETSLKRLEAIERAWPNSTGVSDEDLSIVRELFGARFLTSGFHLDRLVVLKGY